MPDTFEHANDDKFDFDWFTGEVNTLSDALRELNAYKVILRNRLKRNLSFAERQDDKAQLKRIEALEREFIEKYGN